MPVLLYFILQKPRSIHHVWLSITLRNVYESGEELQCHQRKEGTEQLITLHNSYSDICVTPQGEEKNPQIQT